MTQTKVDEADRKTSSSLLLTKGLRLLRYVADNGECGVREIARNMGFSATIAHRLITSLVAEGFLERDEDSRRYRVGAGAFEIGRAFLKSARLENIAPSIMRDLVAEGEFNAFLAVMRGSNVVYLSAMQDNGPINMLMGPGSQAPLVSTSLGKVLLAELPDEEILQRIYFHDHAGVAGGEPLDTVRFLSEIRSIRETGYAVADQEAFRGIYSIGVPIRDFSRRVIAALSLSVPRARLSERTKVRMIKRALEVGGRISHRLGDREN